MGRLLEAYPADSLVVLTGSHASRVSTTDGRLPCTHIFFPTSKGWGRWGIGRIRTALDWLRLSWLTVRVIRLIKLYSSTVIITILHGRFYFAVWAAARITRTPYIVFVHDYYLNDKRSIFGKIVRLGTQVALRDAAKVFAISPGMRERLQSDLGAESEVQLPATKAHPKDANQRVWIRNENPCIVYAGAITNAVEDCLGLLIQVLIDGALKPCGIDSSRIQLYSAISPEQVKARGWRHPDVHVSSWISQADLPRALSKADILFLPFSFREDVRDSIETAFPSKTADYLASGRPILVFGPKYSTLVSYASQEGFAEVVDEFNAEALARGIQNIALSPSRQKTLGTRSLETFSRNHDIERQRREVEQLLGKVASVKRAGPAS